MFKKSRETGTKKENQCKREQKRKNFKTQDHSAWRIGADRNEHYCL